MDYISNASDYPKPLALLNVVFPNILMLKINLADNEAVNIVGQEMEDNLDSNKGINTSNANVDFKPLLHTFFPIIIANSLRLELMQDTVTKQQLN